MPSCMKVDVVQKKHGVSRPKWRKSNGAGSCAKLGLQRVLHDWNASCRQHPEDIDLCEEQQSRQQTRLRSRLWTRRQNVPALRHQETIRSSIIRPIQYITTSHPMLTTDPLHDRSVKGRGMIQPEALQLARIDMLAIVLKIKPS